MTLRKRKKLLIFVIKKSTLVLKKVAMPLGDKEEVEVMVKEVVTEQETGEIEVVTGPEGVEKLRVNVEVAATTVVAVESHLMKMMMDLLWSQQKRSSSNVETITGAETEKTEEATAEKGEVKEEAREVTEAVTDKSVVAEEIVQEENAEAEAKVVVPIAVDKEAKLRISRHLKQIGTSLKLMPSQTKLSELTNPP